MQCAPLIHHDATLNSASTTTLTPHYTHSLHWPLQADAMIGAKHSTTVIHTLTPARVEHTRGPKSDSQAAASQKHAGHMPEPDSLPT